MLKEITINQPTNQSINQKESILQQFPKISEHFSNISEDMRTLPNTFQIFPLFQNVFDYSEFSG